MSSLLPGLNRWLVVFHRWAGIVLALLFAAWFASAAVLHFVPYPALSDADRRAQSEPIDDARLTVEPSVVIARAPDATELRLVSALGEPRYIASFANRPMVAIADGGGQSPRALSAADARSIAERFGHGSATLVDGPLAYDQWTVHQRFDPYRPLYRVRLGDADATELYVSVSTGEVVQRTRQTERVWNWCGAVLHWLYFAPLRHSWNAWNQVVWSVALVALCSVVAGIWLGFFRLAKTRSAGRPGLTPFRGWLGWHHRIGLFASIVVLFWMFSGWLSMDHGRIFSRGWATPEQIVNMQGMPLPAVADRVSLDVIRALSPASSMRFGAVAGNVVVTAWGPSSRNARVALIHPSGFSVAKEIPDELLLAGLRAAWPSDAVSQESMGQNDPYNLAESVSDRAVRFRVADAGQERVYVERDSGTILTVMDPGRRVYAWIYYALHTLNFPGLTTHPLLRSTVVMSLLTVGFGFCITGAVIGFKRLRRLTVGG
jgi:hypothetical protein